jgi:hypothetical protein
LAWAAWAREFREKFPEEIHELIEATVPSGSEEYKKAIRERLHAIRDLMKLSQYRRSTTGSVRLQPGNDLMRDGDEGGAGVGRSKRPRPVPHKPPRKKTDAEKLSDMGYTAEEIAAINDPKVFWLSAKDDPPTRSGGELEDRAAKYLPETNQIHVNADFRGFTDMIDRWSAKYDDSPGARQAATTVIREWFEQALLETVIACKSLQYSQYWSADDVSKLLSPEGLTASVMSRYHIEHAVSRTLGRKLGTLKSKDA